MTKSVLVVDDEATFSFALEHLMKSEGYSVETAQCGKEAIDLVMERHPDLVLLDASLPDRDGYDVCQTIRSDQRSQDIKIVMMNAGSRDIEIEKGLSVGAHRCLSKPFSLQKVAQTVEELLK
ncbi:response regulator [uncultured Cohaesibacter sp.]|uniref:response regulator transcription factor n=1 Tax=uncultured Cohaesibacter sp. TaxID=1002546 RepID=UPI002931752D|nr:response regulator [uncultured Cohaesibacter sp.]